MSDTTIILPARPAETISVADIPINPTDIVMNVIVALLAPMFLADSAGNIGFARLAAIETISAYRARTHADLFTVAQIIGFGLAALGSLSLSMADNISLTMTLRLRANAVALNRGAEQNRRALRKSLAEAPRDEPALSRRAFPVADQPDQPSPAADTAKQPKIAAAQEAPTPAPAPQLAPAAPLPAIPLPAIHAEATITAARPTGGQHDQTAPRLTPEQQSQRAWADVMADEAALLMSSIADLPPEEREIATRQAAALTRTANTIRAEVNGALPEPSIVNPPLGQGPSPLRLRSPPHHTGQPHLLFAALPV